MENTMQMMPQETVEILRENIALKQRARSLEARVTALEIELSHKDAATRERVRTHMEGYAARARHKEIRADIAAAFIVAAKMLAVAGAISAVWIIALQVL